MSPTNIILVIVVVLAVALAILAAVTASKSHSNSLQPSVNAAVVAEKKAAITSLKNKLSSLLTQAKKKGVTLQCGSLNDCLKDVPDDPGNIADLDHVIERLQSIVGSAIQKLSVSPSPQCVGKIDQNTESKYDKSLEHVFSSEKALDSIGVKYHRVPEVATCMKEGLWCKEDYDRCISVLDSYCVDLEGMLKANTKDKWEGWKVMVNAKDKKSLAEYFLLDNPLGTGADPTGAIVDYSFPFEKTTDGKPQFTQPIKDSTPLITNLASGGLKIGITDKLLNPQTGAGGKITGGLVGAPRLISKKLFKGGMFIFDVKHVPIGCGVWPALWMNGFVGGDDQFHGDPKEDPVGWAENMQKLLNSVESGTFPESSPSPPPAKEGFINHLCKKDDALRAKPALAKPNPQLSKFANKDVYIAMWPQGGEIDILENTNFSNSNLVSVHGGPGCELKNGYQNKWQTTTTDAYTKIDARSVCGQTYSGFGDFSGCSGDYYKGNGQEIVLPDGSKRYSCPTVASQHAGNTQVYGGDDTFGPIFNKNEGGIFVCHWEPNEEINIWFFPRAVVKKHDFAATGWPLSDDPDPETWDRLQKTDGKKYLVAAYKMGEPGILSAGCDFNYMGVTMNIAISGGFGGGAMPPYCSAEQTNHGNVTGDLPLPAKCDAFVRQCLGADPKQPGGGNGLGCYDGANEKGRDNTAYFYKDVYFDISSIRVLQKDTHDSVW